MFLSDAQLYALELRNRSAACDEGRKHICVSFRHAHRYYNYQYFKSKCNKNKKRAGIRQPFIEQNRLLLEHFLKFARLIHFAHDVRTTDKLAVHV